MSNRSQDKGTKWATKIVDYLKQNGWPHAERRALTGNKDKGDISGVVGVVIEAKDQQRHDFAGWLDEANVERDNAHADLGVAWVHRRGYASPEKAYVIMDGDTFVALLKAAGY